MNVYAGTFGTGLPTKCPYCHSEPLKYEHVSSGWHADNEGKFIEQKSPDYTLTTLERLRAEVGEDEYDSEPHKLYAQPVGVPRHTDTARYATNAERARIRSLLDTEIKKLTI